MSLDQLLICGIRTNACNGAGGRVGFGVTTYRAGPLMRDVRRCNEVNAKVHHILGLGRPGRETDRARRCILLALNSADELGDSEFDSCHLLSGLYREGNGVAFHILKHFAVTRSQIDDALLARERPRPSNFHIKNDVNIVLSAAFAAVDAMSHGYIGTEHLLIGVLVPRQSEFSPLNDNGFVPRFRGSCRGDFIALVQSRCGQK